MACRERDAPDGREHHHHAGKQRGWQAQPVRKGMRQMAVRITMQSCKEKAGTACEERDAPNSRGLWVGLPAYGTLNPESQEPKKCVRSHFPYYSIWGPQAH